MTASGFPCAKCGEITFVLETRVIIGGLRRRRYCKECGTKVTTYELAAPLTSNGKAISADLVLVPRTIVEAAATAFSSVLAGLAPALTAVDAALEETP